MTASEKRSWERFELINGPIGEKRGDWNAAQICHAILSERKIKKDDGTDLTPEDCLLSFEVTFPADHPEDKNRQLVNEVASFFGKWRRT